MNLPDRETFLNDISFIKNDNLKDKLVVLYDQNKGIINEKIDTYTITKEVIQELFNPYGLSEEPSIPFSFYQTTIGKLIVNTLYGAGEKYYTIKDLVELTKTPARPKGYSQQYLAQEIKDGRLKATKESSIWVITEFEVNRYLKEKGLKE